MNIYAANQIQIKWNEEFFSFFEMSNNGVIKVCNPFPVPTSVSQIRITVIYEDDSKGTYMVPSSYIVPGVNLLEGTFSAEQFSATQFTLMQFDAQFNGVSEVRLDPNALFVIVAIDTPIMGIIPYTTSIKYGGFDFYNMMNDKNSC